MNILFVVKNLSGGGAEKVAVEMANQFSIKHNITVMTLNNEKDKFILDDSISRVKLDLFKKSGNIIQAIKLNLFRVFILRKNILKGDYDIVISFMNRTNIRVLLSLLFTKIPVVITEHNYPEDNPMKGVWEILRRYLYKKSASLVSVSNGISDWFSFLPPEKKKVIYNPVNVNTGDIVDNTLNRTRKNIVAMGRLVDIKGFDILIDAFKSVALENDLWDLSIIGDGKLYNALDKQIKELELQNRVYLLGFKSEPHNIIKNADIFVSSSRSEGLGNAIIEAMMCGVPVISTNCPVGPAELIENGISGILVENKSVIELAEAINKLIKDEDRRKVLVKSATESLYRFSRENIFSQWEDLLTGIKER